MTHEEIKSVGWLHNADQSIALSVCLHAGNHIFVSISQEEFKQAGGIEGLNKHKQKVVDFYHKYGADRRN